MPKKRATGGTGKTATREKVGRDKDPVSKAPLTRLTRLAALPSYPDPSVPNYFRAGHWPFHNFALQARTGQSKDRPVDSGISGPV